MVVPMALVQILRRNVLLRRIESAAEFVAIGSALLFNASNLLITTYDLLEHPEKLDPIALFYTSVGTWSANVLIFALVYWLIDGGGPDARVNGEARFPDFDFPAMADDARCAPTGHPASSTICFSVSPPRPHSVQPKRCL